jgi:hypothetical protein
MLVEIDTGVTGIASQVLAAIDSTVARLPFVMALDADASLTHASTTIGVALAGVAVPHTADTLPANALAEHQGNGAAVVPTLARFAQTLAPALLLLTNLLAHVGTTIGRLLACDALPLAARRGARHWEKDARHGQRDTAAARQALVRCRMQAAGQGIEAVRVQGVLLNVASYVMRSV